MGERLSGGHVPIPSAPTLAAIVSEGLSKGGESSPTTALTTRATNTWIEEIKNDVWTKGKKPKLLHITAYGIFNTGQSKYSNPADYSADLSLTILDGLNRNTAQAGSVNSITLVSTDVSASTDLIGKEIVIMSGTGQASWSQITGYDSTTKIATVSPNFTTAPGAGSGYMVVDQEYPVEARPVFQRDAVRRHPVNGVATEFYPIGDEDFGEFVLNKSPDQPYAARLRYYANIMRVDTDGALFSTVLQQWRNIFTEGIAFKQLDDNDDTRKDIAENRYRAAIQAFTKQYGLEVSSLQDRVTDYN